MKIEIGKVVPGPGPKFFCDWHQPQNFFSTGPGAKYCWLGSAPKFVSEWDWDRDLKLFLAGTGTENDWSRSCVVEKLLFLLIVLAQMHQHQFWLKYVENEHVHFHSTVCSSTNLVFFLSIDLQIEDYKLKYKYWREKLWNEANNERTATSSPSEV